MVAWSKPVYNTCYELGHTWTPYCSEALVEVAKTGFLESFKIYAPLYIIAAILKRRPMSYFLKRLPTEVIRSTIFLGTNAFSFIGAFCLWRKLVGFYCFFNVFACAIPAGGLAFMIESSDRWCFGHLNMLTASFTPACIASFIAIIVERKSRRGMLALYLMNLACETVYRMFAYRGIVTPWKHGEVWLFSVVVAVYMYLYRTRHGLKEQVLSAVKFFVGPDELPPGDQHANDSNHNDKPQPVSQSQSSRGQSSKYLQYCPREVKLLVKRLNEELGKIVNYVRVKPKHHLCRHVHSCYSYSLESACRMFGVGYMVLGGIKVLGSLRSITKRPRAVLEALKHRDNFSLGAFLGCFVGVFKAVNCLLRWLRNTDSNVHGMIAGFLAGWTMMFFKSSTVALYLASKLAEILYFKGIEAGYLPYIKCGDIIIYTLSTAFVFHAAVFEPHNLRPAYWRFLLKLTNNRFAEMNRTLVEQYGTDATKMFKGFKPVYDPRFTDL